MSNPHPLIHALYGDQLPQLDYPEQKLNHPVIQHLLTYVTKQVFLDQKIPESDLNLLISAAQSAVTEANIQLWSVIAVQDKQRIQKLAELSDYQNFVADAPLYLIWVLDLHRVKEVLRLNPSNDESEVTESLNQLDIILAATLDIGKAAQNLLTAARAISLGGVYIGSIRSQADEVIGLLNLPHQTIPLLGLAIGYPVTDEKTQVKPRIHPNVVLHHEQYSNHLSQKEMSSYEDALLEFAQKQGLNKDVSWVNGLKRRLKRKNGREQLKKNLENNGIIIK